MFSNKEALIGIYSQAECVPGGGTIINFNVGTSSGNILVSWGDGTVDTINRFTNTNHQYCCPDWSPPQAFWSNITVCI